MSGDRSKKAFLGSNYPRNIACMEDIFAKILCKLPGKQITDSKLVSKFWHKLIREQQFAQSHFSCSREQKYIIYPYNDDSTQKKLYLMDKSGKISPYVTLPGVDKDSSLKLICSFNGLLCFTKSMEYDELDIYICNPTTQEILKLPKGSPSMEPPSVGIIFETNKMKYKVVRFFCNGTNVSEDTYAMKYEIYSPGDVDWRVIDGVVEPPKFNFACPLLPTTICVGGRMYWLHWSKQVAGKFGYILSMDMDENITRIRLPKLYFDVSEGSFNAFTTLIEYRGRLRLIHVPGHGKEVMFWTLENLEEKLYWGRGVRMGLNMVVNVFYIKSIVTVENELLFVLSTFRNIFLFLNLDKKSWRAPELATMCRECNEGREIFRETGYARGPVVFPFSESLFRCNATD